MNPIYIYFSVEKNLALGVTWLLFILPFYSGVPDSYICTVLVAFCAFMASRCLIRILDRRVQVILDPDGVSIRFLNELTFHWKEIGKVSVSLDTKFVRPACFVTLHTRAPDKVLGQIGYLSYIVQKIMAVFANSEPIILNTSTLTISPRELESAIKSALRSQFHG